MGAGSSAGNVMATDIQAFVDEQIRQHKVQETCARRRQTRNVHGLLLSTCLRSISRLMVYSDQPRHQTL